MYLDQDLFVPSLNGCIFLSCVIGKSSIEIFYFLSMGMRKIKKKTGQRACGQFWLHVGLHIKIERFVGKGLFILASSTFNFLAFFFFNLISSLAKT